MQYQSKELQRLALQVEQGDVTAREKMRKLLVPVLALKVRHTLQDGRLRTESARQIYGEYRRAAARFAAPNATLSTALIEYIAHRLTDHIMAGLMEKNLCQSSGRETVVA